MCSRLGLSMLQRNLLSNADYVMEQEDTQGILIKSRSRKNAIRSLTDCDTLWNPINFKPIRVFCVEDPPTIRYPPTIRDPPTVRDPLTNKK